VGVVPDAVAVDGVLVAPVLVPDVKLLLLIVLLAAAVALLDVLQKEVMDIEGRA